MMALTAGLAALAMIPAALTACWAGEPPSGSADSLKEVYEQGVTFEVFLRPGLRRMLGDSQPFRATAQVELAAAHRHRTGRTELARARLEEREGRLVAHLHTRQGSGSLPSRMPTTFGADACSIGM